MVTLFNEINLVYSVTGPGEAGTVRGGRCTSRSGVAQTALPSKPARSSRTPTLRHAILPNDGRDAIRTYQAWDN
jgi:hypothetical protein